MSEQTTVVTAEVDPSAAAAAAAAAATAEETPQVTEGEADPTQTVETAKVEEAKPVEPEMTVESLTADLAAEQAKSRNLSLALDRTSKRRAAEHEGREAAPKAEPVRAAPEPRAEADPTLRGLQQRENEDGGTEYKVHGGWYDRADALSQVRRDQQLDELLADRETRADEKVADEVSKDLEAVFKGTGETITRACKKAFPGLATPEEAELLTQLSGMITDATGFSADRLLGDGHELTNDLLAGCGAETLMTFRSVVNKLVALQLADNQAAREKEKVKPDAATGVEGEIPLEQQTPMQRRARAEEAARLATLESEK